MTRTTPSIHVDRRVRMATDMLRAEERERVQDLLDAEAFHDLVRRGPSVEKVRDSTPPLYLVPISGRLGFIFERDDESLRYDVVDLMSLGLVEILRREAHGEANGHATDRVAGEMHAT